ncbi:hypothetical protein [Siphonobacter aquaeclarae]|uniref:Uncharacterized protein n=1 Tax=Siphonobacter aquaeclarae TaxID=563176 RepID=A0A1G9T1U6_9BACT|nr:hypothetical protein [Siphonobacter aquaeclarae]SDM41577.1 hypothetical protein SAMN04488090_3378 [Siphonobacter aquaeclarae]
MLIANNLVNSVDFSSLPAKLQETISANPIVFNQFLVDGFAKIREDFIVDESDEKTPLISMEVRDILQPAKDAFDPTPDAVKFGARMPEFHDIDIDLSLKRSDVLTFYRSYLKYVTGLKSQQDVLNNPWPLFFLQQILEKAGHDLATVSAYRAVRNDAQKGAGYVMNGLLYKLAEGRTTGGDIPAANVYDSVTDAAGFDADVYDEINEIAQLTESLPELAGRAMTMEVSARTYRLYKATRRAKSPNTVGLGEQPSTLDDFPNISLKVEAGLGNRRFSWLTVPGNKFFTFNQGFENFNAKLMEAIKGYEANLFFSADVNYGVGKYVFSNDRID